MTLAGLLPPLCDNGGVLVDGGYSMSGNVNSLKNWSLIMPTVDNLPVGHEFTFRCVQWLTGFRFAGYHNDVNGSEYCIRC